MSGLGREQNHFSFCCEVLIGSEEDAQQGLGVWAGEGSAQEAARLWMKQSQVVWIAKGISAYPASPELMLAWKHNTSHWFLGEIGCTCSTSRKDLLGPVPAGSPMQGSALWALSSSFASQILLEEALGFPPQKLVSTQNQTQRKNENFLQNDVLIPWPLLSQNPSFLIQLLWWSRLWLFFWVFFQSCGDFFVF